jgi:hypothetical protein
MIGGGAPPDVSQLRRQKSFRRRRSAVLLVNGKLNTGKFVIGILFQEQLITQKSYHAINSPTNNLKTRPRQSTDLSAMSEVTGDSCPGRRLIRSNESNRLKNLTT